MFHLPSVSIFANLLAKIRKKVENCNNKAEKNYRSSLVYFVAPQFLHGSHGFSRILYLNIYNHEI